MSDCNCNIPHYEMRRCATLRSNGLFCKEECKVLLSTSEKMSRCPVHKETFPAMAITLPQPMCENCKKENARMMKKLILGGIVVLTGLWYISGFLVELGVKF